MVRQLELFTAWLPAKPYCTDNLQLGLLIRPKLQAIERRYIQANPPTRKHWIIADVDRRGAGYDWELLEAPTPNLVVENRDNLHAHLFYGLGIPVHTDPVAQIKPLRYAAAIENALVRKLDADLGYAGLICKNPLSSFWTVRTYQGSMYDLAWLADYLDLSSYADARRRLPAYGLGRNCTLFENLRLWSYRAIRREGWPGFDAWRSEVLFKASQFNDFPCPLPMAEVKATAKSIAKWTWHTMSEAGFRAYQSRVGRLGAHLGAAASAQVRKYKADTKQQLVLGFSAMPCRTVAALTGIPKSTVHRLSHLPISVCPISPISDLSPLKGLLQPPESLEGLRGRSAPSLQGLGDLGTGEAGTA
jgi:hypothetical protein